MRLVEAEEAVVVAEEAAVAAAAEVAVEAEEAVAAEAGLEMEVEVEVSPPARALEERLGWLKPPAGRAQGSAG